MKRMLATILALALCATSALATTNPFTDVSSDSDLAQPVLWALENGITTGTSETTFAPDETCTRGQVVTFLWRAKGEPQATITENPFSDVAETSAYYSAILWAVGEGITTGVTESTFEPNTTCSSAQVATFLYRAMGEPETAYESALSETAAAVYAPAINWADESGLLEDMDFVPSAASPRSDIVTYLYRDAGSPEIEITEEVTEEEIVVEEVVVEEEVIEEEVVVEEVIEEEEVVVEEVVVEEVVVEEVVVEEVVVEEVIEEEEVVVEEVVVEEVIEEATYANVQEEMLVLINEYRTAEGLTALVFDDALQAAADIRAEELIEYYSHTRPDGSSCFTVFSETGVSYRTAGENIAMGQTSVTQVMNAWMNSSGHYANIMGSNFTAIGIGNVGTYWVQMFIG